ncbi:DUF1990 domain-containing protein [Streptomyces sp. H27-C3]|uniref:DUF1990 family protein n=1 Tax=Streptomyces sp. H27-C3 TaxID=3046305 RepID=UPI0024BB9DD1|nr:DUF1990 domain-containing protein [Streptomyces sp. H27-C3]MDJ0465300.1 DUF1990 domain-containing protein [Streptomyces sp. H27-C3]
MSTLNYPEVGATRQDLLPAGYNHLHHRALIGRGRASFEAAGRAVTTWRLHRESGVRVRSDAERADPGVAVECGIGVGPLRVTAPCEVVWAAYEDDRIGFAYGTTGRHPECGEESFVVELADDGAVWFTVTAFSRASRWYTRLAGPCMPVIQHWYARRLGRTLRRIAG